MIPSLARPPVAHFGEQFQQVAASGRRPAHRRGIPVRQVIREPG